MADNFDIDKWIDDFINSDKGNEYLYNLYLNSPSNKAAVRKGFRKFVENTGLKRVRQPIALTFSLASVALASVLYIVWMTFSPSVSSDNWTSVSTSSNESRDLELSDGTTVHLGPCSNVIYPTSFAGSERKIFAAGDVYLDVAKDKKHPFSVSLQGMEVKVHGTKFHLYSYPGIDEQEISLAQGSVSVSLDEGNSIINLSPGEVLKYNKTHNTCKKTTFDIDSFDRMKSGSQILFDNEGLTEIAQKLTKRFGVKVIVCDERLLDQAFYASFINGEGLLDILNRLGEKGDFSIKKDGENYLIMK